MDDEVMAEAASTADEAAAEAASAADEVVAGAASAASEVRAEATPAADEVAEVARLGVPRADSSVRAAENSSAVTRRGGAILRLPALSCVRCFLGRSSGCVHDAGRRMPAFAKKEIGRDGDRAASRASVGEGTRDADASFWRS